MSFIHTLIGAEPPERVDSLPWTDVRIEESTAQSGPWATAETQALSPLDTDPASPMSRDLTFEASIASGWFRLVFIDANNDESPPTAPVEDDGIDDAIMPSVSDVGSLLRARTKSVTGTVEYGTFNSDTRPTADQAASIITTAGQHILAKIDFWPHPEIPVGLQPLARRVIAVCAASLIELSHWPEQVNSQRSAYQEYKLLCEEWLQDLIDALKARMQDSDEDGDGYGGLPHYGFPATTQIDYGRPNG